MLHGAFYTIEMNWGQLMPELSKTRKVIAIEFQGHVSLMIQTEIILNYLKDFLN